MQAKSADIVFDLYCGSGGMSLYLAKKVKRVYGVELNWQAVQDANNNKILNKSDNCEFIQADVADFVQTRLADCNAVVVNPPRSGLATDVVNALIDAQVHRLVYVSCSPTTLARDLVLFLAQGYVVNAVEIIDFFLKLMKRSKSASIGEISVVSSEPHPLYAFSILREFIA